jgi:hypothetical protein
VTAEFCKMAQFSIKFARDFKSLVGLCRGASETTRPQRGALESPYADPLVHRRSGRPGNLVVARRWRTRPPAPFVAAIVAIQADDWARRVAWPSGQQAILLAFGPGACAIAESTAGVCPVEVDKPEIDSLVWRGTS